MQQLATSAQLFQGRHTNVLSVCNKKKHLVINLLYFACSNLPDATVNNK